MFERFTDRARRVVVLAQEEARALNHNYIGTEHVLLGLIHEGEGVAAQALESLGILLDGVRARIEEIIGRGAHTPEGHIPFTPRTKKVLQLALREALQLGHNYIGTEHLLLGLVREGEGVAAEVLVALGADLNRVRQRVIQLLSGYTGREPARPAGDAYRGNIVEVPAGPATRDLARALRRSGEPLARGRWATGSPGHRPVEFYAAFATAPQAAVFLGQLLEAQVSQPRTFHGFDHWFVAARLPLGVGRALVEMCQGQGFVESGGNLLFDRGWDSERASLAVVRSELQHREILDLVRAAGLAPRPPVPRSQVSVFLPAGRARRLLLRALDLQLSSSFRTVRLRPLFAGDDGPSASQETAPGDRPAIDEPNPDGEGCLVEVRLRSAPERGTGAPLPRALISAVERDGAGLICRAATDRLYVQHDRYTPMTDDQLAQLVPAGTWVLAAQPYGCWTLEPLMDFVDGSSLVTATGAHSLRAGEWPERLAEVSSPPAPAPLSIVPARTADRDVDALLIPAGDLQALQLLLEGSPLAESIDLVPGAGRHLILGSAADLSRIAVGETLYGLGRGAVFVAHGWRPQPQVPASAWNELLGVPARAAAVLEPDRTLVFDLSRRRPVWTLWAGDLPMVDREMENELAAALADLVAGPTARSGGPAAPAAQAGRTVLRVWKENAPEDASRGPAAPAATANWRAEALAAEGRGDLAAAAEFHDANGRPEEAARLFEAAARGSRAQ
jgi:hypothetical protein